MDYFLATYLKTFFLSIRRILPLQLWCNSLNHFISRMIAPPPPIAAAAAQLPHTAIILEQPQPDQPPPVIFDQGGGHQENFEWSRLIIAFCFSSAIEMAVQLHSTDHDQSTLLQLHLLSLALSLAFASLFVAKFIHSKLPIAARALERAGVFFAATAFFLAISLPFPLYAKCTNWAIFAASLLAVFACNRFF